MGILTLIITALKNSLSSLIWIFPIYTFRRIKKGEINNAISILFNPYSFLLLFLNRVTYKVTIWNNSFFYFNLITYKKEKRAIPRILIRRRKSWERKSLTPGGSYGKCVLVESQIQVLCCDLGSGAWNISNPL